MKTFFSLWSGPCWFSWWRAGSCRENRNQTETAKCSTSRQSERGPALFDSLQRTNEKARSENSTLFGRTGVEAGWSPPYDSTEATRGNGERLLCFPCGLLFNLRSPKATKP